MKKIIILLLLISPLLCGCSSKEENERNELKEEIKELKEEKSKLQDEVKYINDNLDELKDENNLKQYVLTLNISQVHYSLNLEDHLKDSMNNIDIEIPVSKQYYDNVEKGTVISDDFRIGSFLFKGSFGSWEIKVIDKEIK